METRNIGKKLGISVIKGESPGNKNLFLTLASHLANINVVVSPDLSPNAQRNKPQPTITDRCRTSDSGAALRFPPPHREVASCIPKKPCGRVCAPVSLEIRFTHSIPLIQRTTVPRLLQAAGLKRELSSLPRNRPQAGDDLDACGRQIQMRTSPSQSCFDPNSLQRQ